MNHEYKKAVPVWGSGLKNKRNQFLGFRTELDIHDGQEAIIAISARSYYRLYINGSLSGHGPARTAHKYARVDLYMLPVKGKVSVAIEVAAYSKPNGYSNDITLEPGMLTAEVVIDGKAVSATGWDGGFPWKYTELKLRRSMVDLISHSRGIIEVYDMTPGWFEWMTSSPEKMKDPIPMTVNIPTHLVRRAPYPTYELIPVKRLVRAGDVVGGEAEPSSPSIIKIVNSEWYSMIGESITDKVSAEKEGLFTGELHYRADEWAVKPGKADAFLLWDLGKSEVGFIKLYVEADNDAVIDILHDDVLNSDGSLSNANSLVRYNLKKGVYHLITFEPYLVRYLKIVVRTSGIVKLRNIAIVDYTYPDKKTGDFICSDPELNLIFEGARRTLRLNTLDIFMDCPERERGGWLCDSTFTARAAWMLFGDLSVEADFIENFLLTDPDAYDNAIFPEVYPGNKNKLGDHGITNWSFWFAIQLCEYYKRSGDREIIEKHRQRVERFVQGVMTYKGDGGLYEKMPNLFVDWSQSNAESNLQPVSLPINCLLARMFGELGELYDKPEWKAESDNLWSILREIKPALLSSACSDALVYKDGKYVPSGGYATESGVALEVWSGLKDESSDPGFINMFVEKMGTCPVKPANVYYGRSNLFIGLCIRHDALSQLGKIDTLVRELKDVYLPQMMNGPGTLFESIGARSGCHGFNGHAGVLLMRDVLGLGEPHQLTRTVRIAPHPGALEWASGRAACRDGMIYVDWKADKTARKFTLNIKLPAGWKPDVVIPPELAGWEVKINK